jgi:hypothetical protein
VSSVLQFFASEVDVVFGMRYHSIVFALTTNTKFVGLAMKDHKVHKLIKDNDLEHCFISLDHDVNYKPIHIDSDELSRKLEYVYHTKDVFSKKIEWSETIQNINTIVLQNGKIRSLKVDYDRWDAFEDLVYRIADTYISLLGEDLPDDVKTPRDLLFRTGSLVKKNEFDKSMRLSRFACYVLTNNTDHPCLWGLRKRLSHPELKLWDTLIIVWRIHNDHIKSNNVNDYYTDISPNVSQDVWWTLDKTTFAQEYTGIHRAGWAYAISGLMHRDAIIRGRETDETIFIDTYLDRTFHWSREVFEQLGIIPYKKPWIGFIHHTFDTTFSDYNCVNMLNCESFQQSLHTCKGLLTLSKDLSDKLRQALSSITDNPPPVFTVDHPTELLDESVCFSMDKFNANEKKRVVQIGAWLRDSYAINALPLPKNGGPLKLQKSILKWKNMSQSFAPSNFFCDLYDWLDLKSQNYVEDEEYPICCRNICRNMCRNCDDTSSLVCRNGNVSENASRNHIANKYIDGMMNMLKEQNESVESMEGLDNDNYDKLLQENIVFLKLIEPSAVNTVIECIVRNTPLIVNREPAVEEMLGKDYPGFYDSLFEATLLLHDPKKIEDIYNHLLKLDKTRFHLDRFVNKLQSIVKSFSAPVVLEQDTPNVTVEEENNPQELSTTTPLIEQEIIDTIVTPSTVYLNRPLIRYQRYIPIIFRR